MEQTKPITFQHYVCDLGKLLREAALEVKHSRDSADKDARDYETGRLMAYNEVISLMQQQAVAFGLSLEEVNLDGIDPDSELV
jgi:hypothetical protein